MQASRNSYTRVILTIWLCVVQTGCAFRPMNQWCFDDCAKCEDAVLPSCGPGQLKIDEPCLNGCLDEGMVIPPAPNDTLAGDVPYWELTLDEAISLALTQSKVMRDLGGAILRSPATAATVFDPAIIYTDPRLGEEAALSAFDATLASSAVFEKNDRAVNNLAIGTAGILEQDLHRYQTELRKRTATGSTLAFRHVTDYDYNNQVGNRFGVPSGSWTTFLDAEVRQPLLQGAGVAFNRIAGPTSQAGGVIGINGVNGVLLARMRADVSLAEFEASSRDLVSNVENAYWDLYFAYYDLEAKKQARDASLEILGIVEEKAATNVPGGSAVGEEQAAQAREQYWRFQADVVDALDGRVVEGTQTNAGSSGGTFRGTGGVRLAERRLRLILGIPVNGQQLIKPITDPAQSPISFDWQQSVVEALSQRSELRRQRWRIKQMELELVANRNFLLPRLDATGRYRWRGMGQDLISQSDGQFDSAFRELGDGNYDEWQLGVELAMPLGFRQAHAAVRNSQLMLSREMAILKEQERTVMYGLSNSIAEVRRSYDVMQAQQNRLQSARELLKTVSAQYEGGSATLDLLLEAQRRQIESDIRYQQSRIEYALALKNVHFEKGTLLAYNNIALQEAASAGEAYYQLKAERQLKSKNIDYGMQDVILSSGRSTQGFVGQNVEMLEIPSPAPVDAAPDFLPSPDSDPATAPPGVTSIEG